MSILELLANPEAWVALATLIVMEVVLGLDNLLFISIVTNKLPEHQQARARRVGIAGALILRLALLSLVAWIVGLTAPLFTLFGVEFSWRDLIMLGGGLFLVYKATKEIHERVDPNATMGGETRSGTPSMTYVIGQILVLDMVFSVDSIVTAVGMTPHLPIMVVAVCVAIGVMLVAADPLAEFIKSNPTVVMLALGFLLMIGMTLIAEGFGHEVPKAYLYAAIGFSMLVEGLNMAARRARTRRGDTAPE
ncbi:MAG: TerC family protein [Paracoccaceae bacterium]